MEQRTDDPTPQGLKQRAAARLLRWGFSTACVAENTGLSKSAVSRIRRSSEQHADDDLPIQEYLGLVHASHDR